MKSFAFNHLQSSARNIQLVTSTLGSGGRVAPLLSILFFLGFGLETLRSSGELPVSDERVSARLLLAYKGLLASSWRPGCPVSVSMYFPPFWSLGSEGFAFQSALICAKASIKCLSTGADAHCLCEEKEERKADVFNLYVEQNYSWQASGWAVFCKFPWIIHRLVSTGVGVLHQL